jgi:predicted kinase
MLSAPLAQHISGLNKDVLASNLSMSTHTAHIIITTGRPAAGKSTLAKWLSQELGIPVVSKDSIREVLFDQLGWKDRAWAQKLGRASVDLMFYFAEMQLETNRSLILDNAFDPTLSAPRFEGLKSKYNAETIQIICNSDQKTLFQRFKARGRFGNRHPGHGDEDVFDELQANLAKDQSPIMEIGGTIIEIDTTDFTKIDYRALLRQVKSAIQNHQFSSASDDKGMGK